MPNRGHRQPSGQNTGGLDQDVGCPQCGYNLRGLGTQLVVCPECGQQNDVAKLLVRCWDKPWYRAPKYSFICLPAGIVLLSLMGWMISIWMLAAWMDESAEWVAGLLFVGAGPVCWFIAMAWVWQKLDGPVSASFALLAHVPLVGYLASLVLFLAGLGMTINWFANDFQSNMPSDWGNLFAGLMFLISGLGAFALSHWVERLVAGHCIRLYLRRPTTSG